MTQPPESDVPVDSHWLSEAELRMPPPGPATPGARRARTVASGRTRLLAYAAVGGAVVGSFVAAIIGKNPEGSVDGAMAVGVSVGLVAGLPLGWAIVRLAAARADDTGGRQWSRLATPLLVLPAYLVAGGCGAAASGLAVGSDTDEILASIPGIAAVLLVAFVVVWPLTIRFVRDERSRAASPGAVAAEARTIPAGLLGCSLTFWTAAFAVLWFLGSFVVTLLVLSAIQSLSPSGYQAAVEGSPLGVIAMLVGWLVIWVGGSVAVHRLVRRLSGRGR